MKELLQRIYYFFQKIKSKEWFRYVLIILAVIAGTAVIDLLGGGKGDAKGQSQLYLLLMDIWNDSKMHFVVFLLLSAALLVVKYKKHKRKETGRKREDD